MSGAGKGSPADGQLRMTPEQFLAKREADKADSNRRLRITLAARFLDGAMTLSFQRGGKWDPVEIRDHAQYALRAADILLKEAGE